MIGHFIVLNPFVQMLTYGSNFIYQGEEMDLVECGKQKSMSDKYWHSLSFTFEV